MKGQLARVILILIATALLALIVVAGAAAVTSVTVTSPTHPDENIWYPGGAATFLWPAPSVTIAPVSSYGAVGLMGQASNMAISGNYVFLAEDSGNYLNILNVSNPLSPYKTSSMNPSGAVVDVAVRGSYAYLAAATQGLVVIDISNPASPVTVGTVDTPSWAWSVTVEGNYAYIADGSSGLQVIDISNPALPVLTGSCILPDSADEVAVSGNYAYVGDYDGLGIIDVSDPAGPMLIAHHSGVWASAMKIRGNYVYMACGGSGLKIMDVTDPAAAFVVGGYDTPDNARGIDLSGNYAYVADGDAGLQIIDIFNPAYPTLWGSYDTPGISAGTDVVVGSTGFAYMGFADGIAGCVEIYPGQCPPLPPFGGIHVFSAATPQNTYSYVLDQSPATVPDPLPEGGSTSASFSGLGNGEYYFHVAAIEGSSLGPVSHRRVRIGFPCGVEPGLSLSLTNVRWASFADYQARILTADFNLSNLDGPDGFNVALMGHVTSNAVALETTMPQTMGDQATGTASAFSLRYLVPQGVNYFKTTLYISAEDNCGTSYQYPGPFPGA
ncbi:MAG: LVIVD repeat-containing protein [Thermoleophilia bacterium]